jgi:FkbM family methyltransferase
VNWSLRDLANLEAALAYVPEKRVAVQAGGNVGIFPRRLAEVFTTVYTFEPDAKMFGQLCLNAPADNIWKWCAVLGDDREPVKLSSERRDDSGRPSHPGLTHVVGQSGPGPLVPQMRIDDLHLDGCDLIYLDVEGYELHALRGAMQTIERFRPVIVAEVNRHINWYGTSEDSLRKWVISFGYKAAQRINSDEVFIPCP